MLQNKLNNKGYLQLDVLFALVIFLIIFFMVISEINIAQDGIVSNRDSLGLKISSSQICSLLTTTQGYPSNWDSNISDLIFLGLLNSSNSIDLSKFNQFTNQSNYIYIIDSLNISSILYINFYNLDQTSIASLGTQPSSPNNIEKSSCFSTYMGSGIELEVTLWN